ncbi:HEAT repeat domain-containing protein [Curtobacterium albidum]|uniref:HEAT repeat domain-containing protein n=1 Tax=Curtobacterium citreum TaxID=2036 RepID=A0A850DMY3_9MICO|nr:MULTISPECIES: HEAT repeat domain-containing protein [Curtobacterium]MDK8173370.1 HEAT repeat domain-containing protein [Curtobacterium citreum]NUU26976.1 HEAT repeat domain-containing protein [Curtobacterium albidum]
MTTTADALTDPRSSVRLRAVMALGTAADPADLELLLERCAVDPDLQVREALTWSIVRLPAELTVPRLVEQLHRPEAQARSQAIHTLSKIRDASVYPAVAEALGDPDPGVARTAWRAAALLAPESERPALARRLARELGTGDRERRLALSRALASLGADVAGPVLTEAAERRGDAVREHVADTERLLADPDAGSALAVERARREMALGRGKRASG